MKSLIPIRGTRLYVEEYNNVGDETILYGKRVKHILINYRRKEDFSIVYFPNSTEYMSNPITVNLDQISFQLKEELYFEWLRSIDYTKWHEKQLRPIEIFGIHPWYNFMRSGVMYNMYPRK